MCIGNTSKDIYKKKGTSGRYFRNNLLTLNNLKLPTGQSPAAWSRLILSSCNLSLKLILNRHIKVERLLPQPPSGLIINFNVQQSYKSLQNLPADTNISASYISFYLLAQDKTQTKLKLSKCWHIPLCYFSSAFPCWWMWNVTSEVVKADACTAVMKPKSSLFCYYHAPLDFCPSRATQPCCFMVGGVI